MAALVLYDLRKEHGDEYQSLRERLESHPISPPLRQPEEKRQPGSRPELSLAGANSWHQKRSGQDEKETADIHTIAPTAVTPGNAEPSSKRKRVPNSYDYEPQSSRGELGVKRKWEVTHDDVLAVKRIRSLTEGTSAIRRRKTNLLQVSEPLGSYSTPSSKQSGYMVLALGKGHAEARERRLRKMDGESVQHSDWLVRQRCLRRGAGREVYPTFDTGMPPGIFPKLPNRHCRSRLSLTRLMGLIPFRHYGEAGAYKNQSHQSDEAMRPFLRVARSPQLQRSHREYPKELKDGA